LASGFFLIQFPPEPVSLTPVINHTEILPRVVGLGNKLITDVVDTCGKFITGVNDTSDLSPVAMAPVVNFYRQCKQHR